MRDSGKTLSRKTITRSQETYSAIVERAPFGIYVIDSEFRIVQMNMGSQTGAFRNVRPVIGRKLNEAMRIMWPEPTADVIINRFRQTLETGDPFYSRDFVTSRRDVDATEAYEWELHRIMLPDGHFGVVCYYFDSTQLRKAEAEAREYKERLHLEEERLRLTRTAAKVAPWQYDPIAETFEWSDEARELFGTDSVDVTLASFLSKLSFSGDRDNAVRALSTANSRKKDFEFTFRFADRNGEVKLIMARGRLFYNRGSAILLGMFIDVTQEHPENIDQGRSSTHTGARKKRK